MGRVTITVTIDVPEGAVVGVHTAKPVNNDEGPPIEDWPVPVIPAGAPQSNAAPTTSQLTCPEHRVPMVYKRGGISKRTGAAYTSFYACPTVGCKYTANP